MATQKTSGEYWLIIIFPIICDDTFIKGHVVSWNMWIYVEFAIFWTEVLTPSKWSLCSHTPETRGGGTGDRARMERSTATRLCQALNTAITHCPDAEMGVAWCGLAIARCVFGVYRGHYRH